MLSRLTIGLQALALLCPLLAATPALSALPQLASVSVDAACDGPQDQRLLQAQAPGSAAKLQAQAYWLDRASIQWPGVAADATSRFKLYVSPLGELQTEPGLPVRSAQASAALTVLPLQEPAQLPPRFKFVAPGVRLQLGLSEQAQMPDWLRMQVLLVQEDAQGMVVRATQVQLPGALDDWYAGAGQVPDLGVSFAPAQGKNLAQTRFKLWAPTAQRVSLCLYPSAQGAAQWSQAMQWAPDTGVWQAELPGHWGGAYYRYLVDVWVPGLGWVRNRVTDPYSLSLNANSQRSYVADLQAAELQPPAWRQDHAPQTVTAVTDMVIYELHVRDFSASDASVPQAHRGKYLAFTHAQSQGMRHLRALAKAGLTDVHLLPVFDFATVPEVDCATPKVSAAAPDSEAQQAQVMAQAAHDCFNWGYDPYHYSAPEGSYASDANDGARRVLEFRAMVQALHQAGLRVGMDVVYNHTSASGQASASVLDRIVPGYYQRLNAQGQVEQSTCCANTATEHTMMGKLVRESVALWARDYHIDSFRFDLMGHQPRDLMEAVQAQVNQAAGRTVQLLGEGWNFGEIANGARFVQASQLSLNGSGIATFSDRGRDALRGGSAGDSGAGLVQNQGYLNGLVDDPNALAPPPKPEQVLDAADLVRVALAGSVRSVRMVARDGQVRRLDQLRYGDQIAGYVSEPGEVVNYVENHDNQTLFDINALRLPAATSAQDRVKVQALGAAVVALSQGVAYFHAGQDILRSKSLDSNSFDSGDWFNRLDWSYRSNGFGVGAPPAASNAANYPWLKPVLARANAIRPSPAQIALSRDVFGQWLQVRASSSLLRLRSAADIVQRLRFDNTGPQQNPALIVAHLDGQAYAGAGFTELLYVVNVSRQPQSIDLLHEAHKAYRLHPALRGGAYQQLCGPAAGGKGYDQAQGRFTLGARCAAVWVVQAK